MLISASAHFYYTAPNNSHHCAYKDFGGWFGVAVTALVASTKLSYVEPPG